MMHLDRRRPRLATMLAIAALLTGAALLAGPAEAKSTSFDTVPVNIADAPAVRWLGVERADRASIFVWEAKMPGGVLFIEELAAKTYWPSAFHSSERSLENLFERHGFTNFRNFESTAAFGSQWGYVALATGGVGDCVVGATLDNDLFYHDGEEGGKLRAILVDCGSGATGRLGAWAGWMRSLKRVPEGYNAKLD